MASWIRKTLPQSLGRIVRSVLGYGFHLLEIIGFSAAGMFRSWTDSVALATAAVTAICHPGTWRRAVRTVLARQILFTAVDGTTTALRVGGAVGVLLVVQTALWLESYGADPSVVAPAFWRLAVRELAPLMACLIVIGRSGSAIAVELASMKVNEELELLESQGIDVMTYLVAPRIAAVTVSVFALGLVMVTAMLGTGYIVGSFVGAITSHFELFVDDMLRHADRVDALFFLSKTLLAGLFVGVACCGEGLNVRFAATDVPRVAGRSGVRALNSVFFVSAVLSLIIYGRVLIFQVI